MKNIHEQDARGHVAGLLYDGVLSAQDWQSALDAMREALGLSPSEARLAVLLATGRTVKDYARIEGCSWHTARTHMKNLMRKTGCHRQVELVGLLQSLQPR